MQTVCNKALFPEESNSHYFPCAVFQRAPTSALKEFCHSFKSGSRLDLPPLECGKSDKCSRPALNFRAKPSMRVHVTSARLFESTAFPDGKPPEAGIFCRPFEDSPIREAGGGGENAFPVSAKPEIAIQAAAPFVIPLAIWEASAGKSGDRPP